MVSVMYFDAATALATQRTALQTFWTSIKAVQASVCLYDIALAGRELDMATGILTGSWSTGTVFNGAGGSGTNPVPDASMALIQWRTSAIINGRFSRGRTFVPGLGVGQILGGNLLGTANTTITNAAAALAASGAGFVVWHRPIAKSGGAMNSPTTTTVWPELAVLRRRRG